MFYWWQGQLSSEKRRFIVSCPSLTWISISDYSDTVISLFSVTTPLLLGSYLSSFVSKNQSVSPYIDEQGSFFPRVHRRFVLSVEKKLKFKWFLRGLVDGAIYITFILEIPLYVKFSKCHTFEWGELPRSLHVYFHLKDAVTSLVPPYVDMCNPVGGFLLDPYSTDSFCLGQYFSQLFCGFFLKPIFFSCNKITKTLCY